MRKTFIILLTLFCQNVFAQNTTTFNYTGAEQFFVVPSGLDSIFIESWGAQGGEVADRLDNSDGGLGGFVSGKLKVNAGDTLYIYVGGQGLSNGNGGYNGGGNGGYGYAGGDCSGGYGSGGTGATLTWFTATGGGGTNLGTANPLHHIPLSNTTYYARLSGICNTVEANASVIVNSLPVISSITSSRNPSVNGYAPYQCADLTVTATGAGSLTYDWSNAATGSVINVCPTVGTTYEVMVTDGNGCIETDTFRQKVIEGNSPYAGRIILCYSYPRRAPTNIHVYPTQVQQYLNAGATLGACGNIPNKRNFDAFYDDIYRIYPNPAQNQITVEWFSLFNEIVNIDLVDMTGRVVKNIFNGEVLEGNISLTTTDVSNLPAGMYFMRYSSPTDVRINKVQLMR